MRRHRFCKLPGPWRIRLYGLKSGSQWICPRCNRDYRLRRRNPVKGFWFWEWRLIIK